MLRFLIFLRFEVSNLYGKQRTSRMKHVLVQGHGMFNIGQSNIHMQNPGGPSGGGGGGN